MSQANASTEWVKNAPVGVGDIVAGKYRVDSILGRGGMGIVVSATDLELDRKVAIKFIERNDEQATARFLREARAAANLDSQHITRVFECGHLEHGPPFIVMEQLHGDSFSTLVQSGAIGVREAASYMIQICDALAQAHAKRLVHRDLKPDNLFLHTRTDGSRIVKVLDFGVSKALGGTVLTESSAIVGSPPYLAPEQIEHPDRVDPRTDIWALGVVFYELISGERPFRGATMVELCMNILSTEPPLLGSKVDGLPVGIEQIAARCLSKQMEARFQSVAELAQALQPFCDAETGLLLSAIRRALGHDPATQDTVSASGVRRQPGVGASRRPVVWIAGALLAVGCLAFAGSRALPTTSAVPAPRASVEPLALATPPPPAPSASPPTPVPAVTVTPEPSAPAPKPVDVRVAAAPPPATGVRPRRVAASGPKTPKCRVIEVVEDGHVVQASAARRVTFEWARRLCTSSPRAGTYRLSESGIGVKCACD